MDAESESDGEEITGLSNDSDNSSTSDLPMSHSGSSPSDTSPKLPQQTYSSARSELDESESEEGETVILAILDHKWAAKRPMFLVHWEDDDETWETLTKVNDCQALDVYLATQNVSGPWDLQK